MGNETFASVWDATEDTPEQAENMKLRSGLMMALKAHITRNGPPNPDGQIVWRDTAKRVRPHARKIRPVWPGSGVTAPPRHSRAGGNPVARTCDHYNLRPATAKTLTHRN